MMALQEAIVDAQSARIRELEMETRTLQVIKPSSSQFKNNYFT